jgi:uncharacterized protein
MGTIPRISTLNTNMDAGPLYQPLWTHLENHFACPLQSVHGPSHWRRVERNALLLATKSGADIHVLRLFAVFHDSCRRNDSHDPRHGPRAAILARELHGSLFESSQDQLDLLAEACQGHTHLRHSGNPTVGTSWDADRLDLGRVGIVPRAKFMSTAFAKEIANLGSTQPFLKEANML